MLLFMFNNFDIDVKQYFGEDPNRFLSLFQAPSSTVTLKTLCYMSTNPR